MEPERKRVADAEAEAKRFLARVAAWKKAQTAQPDRYGYPKESGAMKRASMDLSRALAVLRRGDAAR